MLENLFVGFSKRISFWDIPKWNRSPIIWDGESINYFIHKTITFVPQFYHNSDVIDCECLLFIFK